jgi:hypothetical protein
MPATPQNEAGCRIDPPVSVPVAPAHSDAAIAAADPPDDPPGTCAKDHGLRTGPRELFSFDEPMANSSMLSLPSDTAPASARRCVTVDSNGGTNPRRIFDAHVVSIPRVTKMSLMPIGTPASAPGSRPPARAASTASARRRAPSASTST